METLWINLIPLFRWVVTTSVEATILVGLILFFQRLFRHRLSALWQYGLWLLLLLKLTVPVFWDSPIEGIPLYTNPIIHAPVLSEQSPSMEMMPASQMGSLQMQDFLDEKGTARFNLPWIAYLALGWLLGMLIMLVHMIRSSVTWIRKVNQEKLPEVPGNIRRSFEQISRNLNIRCSIGLQYSDKVNSPSLFGLFKPMVLLPRSMMDSPKSVDYRHIFTHELMHYKRRDVGVNLWSSVLLCMHWFNPILWYGISRMRADQEMACDAQVLRTIGDQERLNYAGMIIQLAELGAAPAVLVNRVGLSSYRNQLKRRLTMIHTERKFRAKHKALGIIVMIVLLGVIWLGGQSSLAEKNAVTTDEVTVPEQGETDDQPTFIVPVEGKVITPFGKTQKAKGVESYHMGIDIANQKGTPVLAMSSGVVTFSDYTSGHGFMIIIQHEGGWETRYSHLDKLMVKKGEQVEQGDTIGLLGETGRVTGPVLHVEVLKDGHHQDPAAVIEGLQVESELTEQIKEALEAG